MFMWWCCVQYLSSGRRLFEEDNPLEIALEASVTNRNSKLILRDNTYSTIQWDAFTQPELNNFIQILRREEELYVDKVCGEYSEFDVRGNLMTDFGTEEIVRCPDFKGWCIGRYMYMYM